MNTWRNPRRLTQLAAIVAVVPLIATASACSSQSSSSPSSSAASSMTSVLPPIPVSKGGPLSVKVNDHLNVITPAVTRVETDNATVLDVSQPYNDGSATFNGGAKVLTAGTAKMSVFDANDQLLYVVDVTATN